MLVSLVCVLTLNCMLPVSAVQNSSPADNEIIFDNYNNVIQMTNEEALSYFKNFLNSRAHTISTDNYYTVEALESFTAYATEEGIIVNTPEQKSELSKATVRGLFTTVADVGRRMGYTTAATLLKHSLQDTPSVFNRGSTSTYGYQIAASTECIQIVGHSKKVLKMLAPIHAQQLELQPSTVQRIYI